MLLPLKSNGAQSSVALPGPLALATSGALTKYPNSNLKNEQIFFRNHFRALFACERADGRRISMSGRPGKTGGEEGRRISPMHCDGNCEAEDTEVPPPSTVTAAATSAALSSGERGGDAEFTSSSGK